MCDSTLASLATAKTSQKLERLEIAIGHRDQLSIEAFSTRDAYQRWSAHLRLDAVSA
jgi:hypothetical protein